MEHSIPAGHHTSPLKVSNVASMPSQQLMGYTVSNFQSRRNMQLKRI